MSAPLDFIELRKVAVGYQGRAILPPVDLRLPGKAAQLIARRVATEFLPAVLFALGAGLIGYYFAFSHEWPAGPSLVVAAALFLLPGAALRLLRRRR